MMVDTDGRQVLRTLKADPDLKKIPVYCADDLKRPTEYRKVLCRWRQQLYSETRGYGGFCSGDFAAQGILCEVALLPKENE